MSARGVVIAGTSSGTGKTSLSLGIMGALRRRGHEVAPFKVGPDYIDPGYHAAVSGRPSRNLDTWLMSKDQNRGVFHRALRETGASAAVIEGVMGLFDGLGGGTERCSTAEMAKLLGLPVVLVVDCSAQARSAAAVVHGFATFDAGLEISGVILNKVGSERHAQALREALAGGPPVVGLVPRRADLHLESRHLGLVLAEEDPERQAVLEAIVDHVEEHVDLDFLLDRSAVIDADAEGMAPPGPRSPAAGPNSDRRPVVAVARDAAFSFYYQDNLDVLEEEGAEVVYFKPVEGERLPACDAVYMGGGYPELHAAPLADNDGLRRDIRDAVADGVRIYAECGGYLYLGRSIELGGAVHRMAGVLPTYTDMTGRRLRLGYVEATAADEHPLTGATFRGHLFHYSSTSGADRPAYRVSRHGEGFDDGWSGGNAVASYVHLHFRGSRGIARWLARGEAGIQASREEEQTCRR